MTDAGSLAAEPLTRDGQRASAREVAALAAAVPHWTISTASGTDRLQRIFSFPAFAPALAFAVEVGALAEACNHHPSLLVEWGRVVVGWWTQQLYGLHHDDFVMAARTDALYARLTASAREGPA